MISCQITAERAADAAVDALIGVCEVVVHLFDWEAASRLVGIDQKEIEEWMSDGATSGVRRALRNATLPTTIALLAEYAWGGRYRGSEGELDDLLTEAIVVLPLLQSGPAELVNAQGEGVISPESRDILATVVDAATARRTLDSASYGDINVAMLAALAGVSEKTIRMAANPKNANALRTTKVGNSTFVLSDDALEWLRRRDGFQETVYNADSSATPAVKDPESLAKALVTLRARRAMSVQEVSAALNWNGEKRAAYEQLELATFSAHRIALTPGDMLALARLMNLDAPVDFAKQAYRAMVASFADSMLIGIEKPRDQG